MFRIVELTQNQRAEEYPMFEWMVGLTPTGIGPDMFLLKVGAYARE